MSAFAVAAASGCCCESPPLPCSAMDVGVESIKAQYDSLSLNWPVSAYNLQWPCCGGSMTITLNFNTVGLQRVITSGGVRQNKWQGQVNVGAISAPSAPCTYEATCCNACPATCTDAQFAGNYPFITCMEYPIEYEIAQVCGGCTCCTVYTSPNLEEPWCDEPCYPAGSEYYVEYVRGVQFPIRAYAELSAAGAGWNLSVRFIFISTCPTPGLHSSFVGEYPSQVTAVKPCLFPGDGPRGIYRYSGDCSTGWCTGSGTETVPCIPSGMAGSTYSRNIGQFATVS